MNNVKSNVIDKPIRVKAAGFEGWVSMAGAKASSIAGDWRAVGLAIEEIAGCREAGQIVYKDDARSEVREVCVADKKWIVKQVKMGGVKGFVYGLLRMSPPWREWRGCLRLALTGCDVIGPLGLVRVCGGVGCGAGRLVFPAAEGGCLYHWMMSHPRSLENRKAREAIAYRMGEQVGLMTSDGVINRDFKPSNWVLRYDRYRRNLLPVMIDLVGLRKGYSEQKIFRMLGAFGQASQGAGGVTMRECLCFMKGFTSKDVRFLNKQRRRAVSILRGAVCFYKLHFED